MAKYHGEGDRRSPLVQLELREMMDEISKTGADKRWWDFRELFDSREVRYRTMLTCAIALFGQWTGNGMFFCFCVTNFWRMIDSAKIGWLILA